MNVFLLLTLCLSLIKCSGVQYYPDYDKNTLTRLEKDKQQLYVICDKYELKVTENL